MSKYIAPKQVCGMWLIPTIWNEFCLSGPIPGSKGMHDQSANMVTICNVLNLPKESVESDNMLESVKNLSDFDNISLTNK